ncbi:MAG: DUF3488 and DUF4129 domain-containing transglutaminase family protein [Salinigranum sp.]
MTGTGNSADGSGSSDRRDAGSRSGVVGAGRTAPDPYRAGALAAILLLTASYLSVLYHVTDVVGGVGPFLAVTVAAFVLATALGRTLRVRTGLVLSVVLVVGGFAAYLLSLPRSQLAVVTVGKLLSDTVALLTGLSVLRLTAAGTWAMTVAPGPVFLSWYLAVRKRYVGSAVAGGTALMVFVLTGDVDPVTTLVGVCGAVAAVGLGTLDLRGGSIRQVDTLAMVLAAILVLSLSVSVVPGGAAQPLFPDRSSPTGQSSVVDAGNTVEVLGSIRLSPQVRFTVQSDRSAYWQTAAYDRYTGAGWVRTGNPTAYSGPLEGPPGRSRRVEQTVTAEAGMQALPAAWKPTRLSGVLTATASVTPQGTLRPGKSLSPGQSYTVVSRVPVDSSTTLRRAGTDYPAAIRDGYLQLPSSTPDRVRRKAAEITAGADTPYAKAVAVEDWLRSNKRYTLTVDRPSGDVADAFLFRMDAGYCVYYATTMVVLLRAQGVPARFVTGYSPGQDLGNGTHVVRGLDSHAWVQVYFPDVGWVNFDPTPPGPRRAAERARVAEARRNGVDGVDTGGSKPTPTPTPSSTGNRSANATAGPNASGTSGDLPPMPGRTPAAGRTPAVGPAGSSGGGPLPDLPSRRTLGVGLIALAGLAAWGHRAGGSRRVARLVGIVHQRASEDPEADVERAFQRLELLLASRGHDRGVGQTPRGYLQALSVRGVDERVLDVGRAYERAHYGRGVTRAEADRVVSLVDELARDALFRRRSLTVE